MIIFLLFVREPVTSLSGLIKANTLSLKKNLISAFKNVPFLSLLSMFIFCWIALNFLTSNLFLYVKYVVHKEQNYTVILFLIMVLIPSSHSFSLLLLLLLLLPLIIIIIIIYYYCYYYYYFYYYFKYLIIVIYKWNN